MGQAQDQPDLTNAQLAAPLRHASFITGCGAPDDMKVTVRVAVKMGHAVGVTVSTNPSSPASPRAWTPRCAASAGPSARRRTS